jgi:hypothetical protein
MTVVPLLSLKREAISSFARCAHSSAFASQNALRSTNALRAEQPGVDDLPPVPASCLEIQKRRLRVL